MDIEQQKALALASARKRAAETQDPSLMDTVARQLGLTARILAEGIADIAAPFANPVAAGANAVLGAAGSDYRFPEQSQGISQLLTDMGVPKPSTAAEKVVNTAGRIAVGVAVGGPLNKAVASKFPSAPDQFVSPRATTEAGKVLEQSQIPLDKGQATGNRFLNRFRSAFKDNPITAGAQEKFTEAQQKGFNRAVLRAIGEDSDEASQEVMSAAKSRIGQIFDRIGRNGAEFDDVFQNRVAAIVDEAKATVPNSEMGPLLKNVNDLVDAIDDTGKINGDILVKVRSRLSTLAKNPNVSESARDLQDALLDAIERSNPGEKKVLQSAIDQWRSLRLIEGAIAKGSERDISPLMLSNAIASKGQRAMSVYGQGGNQDLVKLAQAARTVLPETIPQSGTAPRGLMQAPIRSLLTSSYLYPLQRYIQSQPSNTSNFAPYILPAAGIANRASQ